MPKNKKIKSQTAITWLVVANTITGVYNPLVKYSLGHMPLYNFALFRHAGPALLILPLALREWRKIKKRDWLLAILSGLIMYVGANTLFYLGIERTGSINAAVLFMLEPILLFIFSVELMREHFKKKVFSGILIAFAGSALVIVAPALTQNNYAASSFIGNILLLGNVACCVVSVWFMKSLTRRIPTFQLLFIGLATAAIIYFVLSIPTISDMSALGNPLVLFTVIYGIIAVGAVSYWLRFWSLKAIGGQEYGLVSYVEPALTATVAYLFFHESFTPTTATGIVLVFVGVWLAEARIHRHWHLRHR